MSEWILRKIREDNKGFTLVELVVVIAILGILAAAAVPKLTISRKNAALTVHEVNIRTLEGAASMYLADEGTPTEEIIWNPEGGTKAKTINDPKGKDAWAKYLQEWPKLPTGTGNASIDGKNYKVTIAVNGDIEVTSD